MDFTTFSAAWRERIETALRAHMEPCSGCPEQLTKAMAYGVLDAGKRLRPLLVLMAAEACGGPVEAALPAACAVEMVHCYSLIHDDLPAMDDDDLRRGRPTVHRVFGEGLAVLAGDALLTQAFGVLAAESTTPEIGAASVVALASAAGPHGMVGGQVDDIAAAPDDLGELAKLESVHQRKTGALLRASLRLGGLAAGAGPRELTALEAYGYPLGLAFQITDDLLDVCGQEQAVGKRVGKDSTGGKRTFPALLGIETSRRRVAELVDEACVALRPLGAAAEPLASLACFVRERDR